jgi:hypothetical protein
VAGSQVVLPLFLFVGQGMHCPTMSPVDENVPGGQGTHTPAESKNVPGLHPLVQPPLAVRRQPAMQSPAEVRVEPLKMHSLLDGP